MTKPTGFPPTVGPDAPWKSEEWTAGTSVTVASPASTVPPTFPCVSIPACSFGYPAATRTRPRSMLETSFAPVRFPRAIASPT